MSDISDINVQLDVPEQLPHPLLVVRAPGSTSFSYAYTPTDYGGWLYHGSLPTLAREIWGNQLHNRLHELEFFVAYRIDGSDTTKKFVTDPLKLIWLRARLAEELRKVGALPAP